MKLLRISPLLIGVLLLGACVSMPKGPSVMVLPGSGKSFDQFRYDDVECRQFADFQIGGSSPSDAAADSVAKSAALGTVVGAAAGAALGGRSGAAAGARGRPLLRSAARAGAGERSAGGPPARDDYPCIPVLCANAPKSPWSRPP